MGPPLHLTRALGIGMPPLPPPGGGFEVGSLSIASPPDTRRQAVRRTRVAIAEGVTASQASPLIDVDAFLLLD
jgi:hypothetical protein